MDPAAFLPAVGTVGLFAATSTVLYRMMRRDERLAILRDQEIADLRAETARLETRNRECDRRVTVLILACQRGGIAIPEDVWL